MKPITEYWKNHAVTEAGPTVRNGVAGPSLKTIASACQGEGPGERDGEAPTEAAP